MGVGTCANAIYACVPEMPGDIQYHKYNVASAKNGACYILAGRLGISIMINHGYSQQPVQGRTVSAR